MYGDKKRSPLLKVRKSRVQIMVSSILPKNERWDNFHYIKLSQRSFFGRIDDTINCFQDLLIFNIIKKIWFCTIGPIIIAYDMSEKLSRALS